MTNDPRCCGSGTCIIDAEGRCWCGQQWNGQEMVAPALDSQACHSPPATSSIDCDVAAHP
jgi:hypothetical protein